MTDEVTFLGKNDDWREGTILFWFEFEGAHYCIRVHRPYGDVCLCDHERRLMINHPDHDRIFYALYPAYLDAVFRHGFDTSVKGEEMK